jgi:hypothetical protein
LTSFLSLKDAPVNINGSFMNKNFEGDSNNGYKANGDVFHINTMNGNIYSTKHYYLKGKDYDSEEKAENIREQRHKYARLRNSDSH